MYFNKLIVANKYATASLKSTMIRGCNLCVSEYFDSYFETQGIWVHAKQCVKFSLSREKNNFWLLD